MSADNWAVCPQCYTNETARVHDLKTTLDMSYGVVPLEQFDALRTTYEVANTELDYWGADTKYATFREDYEIYGAAEGTITVSYRGGCSKCDLKHEFTINEQFYP